MKTRHLSLFSTAALAFGATLLLAPNTKAADEKTKLNNADERFIQDEAAAGGYLVKLAKLASEKAKREDVKVFAGMLAADHTKANAELATLAASKGVELSSEPIAKYGDMQDKLERTSGADFDGEFLSMVVSAHEKCLKNFKEASTDAADVDLKAWAATMVPGLQAHLEKAEELNSVKTTKTRSESTGKAATEPDNTARNMRDRDTATLTPLDQGNGKADIDTTAKIRREIVDLEGLSVNAQNVKIITNEGRVTLRGPVDSAEEKRLVGEIATRIATSERTDNQLEVRGPSAAN
jgi:putative membrane protein